jgi:hypothetical protein
MTISSIVFIVVYLAGTDAWLFEDVDTSMVELHKHLLNMLYIWIASHHYLNDFTYVDFLNLLSSRPI